MPTVRDIRARVGGEPITMLTAYDAPTAALLEEAGIDVALVGDSVGNTSLGHESTLPVTFEEMLSRAGAVARATEEALVVVDMPFLSVGVDRAQSVEHCGRMLKEAHADAVKVESGPHTVDLVEHLVTIGVPTMAHLGLTPQRVKETGYTRQGRSREEGRRILDLAREHADAGAFALVLEHIPANLARQVTEAIDIPTIGIGAGSHVDGQVLVVNDVVGLSDASPPFARQFGDVRAEMAAAMEGYREAVHDGSFPAEEHTTVDPDLDELY